MHWRLVPPLPVTTVIPPVFSVLRASLQWRSEIVCEERATAPAVAVSSSDVVGDVLTSTIGSAEIGSLSPLKPMGQKGFLTAIAAIRISGLICESNLLSPAIQG